MRPLRGLQETRVVLSWVPGALRAVRRNYGRRLVTRCMVPTSWQDEALARDGVSREVPGSALKGETVPDSLPATPKSPPTRRVPPRGTKHSWAPVSRPGSSPPCLTSSLSTCLRHPTDRMATWAEAVILR